MQELGFYRKPPTKEKRDRDEVRLFSAMPFVSYLVLTSGMILVAVLSPPTGIYLLAPLVLGIGLLGGTLIFWVPDAGYPWRPQKRKAAVLWLYGMAVTVPMGAYLARSSYPWWVPLAVSVYVFFHLTSLTFGELPGYGGAWRESREIASRKRLLELDRHRGSPGDDNDWVATLEVQVCIECLSVVREEDLTCWRCKTLMRSERQFAQRWFAERASKWTKRETKMDVAWTRVWHPEFTYRNPQGTYVSDLGVWAVVGWVDSRGRWLIRALASTVRSKHPHPVLVEKGRARNSSVAKEAVEERVLLLDLKRIVEVAG